MFEIINLTRTIPDGNVFAVEWKATYTEGEFSKSTTGVVTVDKNVDGTFIPYESLTEEIVLGWLDTALDKQAILDGLKAQLQVTGLPWNVQS